MEYIRDSVGTYLAAFWWLRLNAPSVGGRGFDPRLGNKIAHALWEWPESVHSANKQSQGNLPGEGDT